MEWNIVLDYVRPELFIVVVVLWCIGLFLKLAPAFKKEWMIPFILLFTGIVLSLLWICVVLGEGWAAAVVISAIVQGVIVAALAVFGNEALKQLLKKRPIDEVGE